MIYQKRTLGLTINWQVKIYQNQADKHRLNYDVDGL
jgi:hypothetical protein